VNKTGCVEITSLSNSRSKATRYRVYEKNLEEQQVPFEGLVTHLHYQDVAQLGEQSFYNTPFML